MSALLSAITDVYQLGPKLTVLLDVRWPLMLATVSKMLAISAATFGTFEVDEEATTSSRMVGSLTIDDGNGVGGRSIT